MMDVSGGHDRYLDLPGLSEYASLGVSTLRDYLKAGGLPHYKLKGKILVRISEFDRWMESFRVDSRKDLNRIADEALKSLKRKKSENYSEGHRL